MRRPVPALRSTVARYLRLVLAHGAGPALFLDSYSHDKSASREALF